MPQLKGESLKIILISILGSSAFIFADTVTKYLSEEIENFSAPLYLTITSIMSCILLFCWILYDKGWKGFLSAQWKWLVAQGICVGLIATLSVNAVALIPLTDLYSITFAAPFVAVSLAYILLKEEVGWHRWFCISLGLSLIHI